MDKIPFDIKFRPQIESGECKVETRDGREARIICWDSKAKDARFDTRPIIALVTTPIPELESLIQCGENGILYKYAQDRNDLFLITPEPELSEFEKEYIRLYKEGYADGQAGSRPISDDGLKEYAAELLELANKELKNHEFAIFTREEFDAEIEEAKAEALKDLPRWKKATCGKRFDDERTIVLTEDNELFCTCYAKEGEYYISSSELKKLPKEE